MKKEFWILAILYFIGYSIIMTQVPVSEAGGHSAKQWLIVIFGSWFFILGAILQSSWYK